MGDLGAHAQGGGGTGHWVCEAVMELGTEVAQAVISYKSGYGLFCLLVSYSLQL